MRVLVTGDLGRLGSDITSALHAVGHDVLGFDRAAGHDILNAGEVAHAVSQVEAVVHLAGIADDRMEDPSELFHVNVVGTWNVLAAAKETPVKRVVYASSGKALGMLATPPAWLPVDDEHPGAPFRPYGLSKWLSEEMCEAFTRDTGIPTICLRPVLVLDDERWPVLGSGTELPPARGTAWHLAAFVDQQDTVDAFVRATTGDIQGHQRLLLCAADVGSDRPTAELTDENLPGVPWRSEPPSSDSRRSLIDCKAAERVLGWRPSVRWETRPTKTT